MIGTQDELLKWIMSMREWYLLMKHPVSAAAAHNYKVAIDKGTLKQSTKDSLCKELGIQLVRKEVVLPAVYEYKRIPNPKSETQKFLSTLIFGYTLPTTTIEERKEELRLKRVARGEKD